MDLVNRDTDAFNQVMAAFKLPKGTDEEKHSCRQAIQAATRLATEVPFVLGSLPRGAETYQGNHFFGNKNAPSDGV